MSETLEQIAKNLKDKKGKTKAERRTLIWQGKQDIWGI